MKKRKRAPRRTTKPRPRDLPSNFTDIERAAIGELVEVGSVAASSKLPALRDFAAVMFERAAKIVRGTTKPYVYRDRAIRVFVTAWKVHEPKAFSGE